MCHGSSIASGCPVAGKSPNAMEVYSWESQRSMVDFPPEATNAAVRGTCSSGKSPPLFTTEPKKNQDGPYL